MEKLLIDRMPDSHSKESADKACSYNRNDRQRRIKHMLKGMRSIDGISIRKHQQQPVNANYVKDEYRMKGVYDITQNVGTGDAPFCVIT